MASFVYFKTHYIVAKKNKQTSTWDKEKGWRHLVFWRRGLEMKLKNFLLLAFIGIPGPTKLLGVSYPPNSN